MILTINEVHTLLARLEEICAGTHFGQGSAGNISSRYEDGQDSNPFAWILCDTRQDA